VSSTFKMEAACSSETLKTIFKPRIPYFRSIEYFQCHSNYSRALNKLTICVLRNAPLESTVLIYSDQE